MKNKKLRLLYGLGRPFAPFYSMLMSLRATLYRKGILRQVHLDIPVISVGNLTMGGSGKTPMTIYLADLLREKEPVVVSRGYGGKAAGKINVVSNREKLLMGVKEAGDESFLLASSLPGIPVVTGPKKRFAAKYAASKFRPGVIIVDDAFQHLGLARDLDMVLFKVDSFLGNNRVFPGGDMREPLKALERADCFVLNCAGGDDQKADAIEKALQRKFPRIPVFKVTYQEKGLIDQANRKRSAEDIRGRKYFGFCALAEPLSFRKTLEEKGAELTGFQAYPDHHFYSDKDLKKIEDAAILSGAEELITTEKDMVKIGDRKISLPFLKFSIGLIPLDGISDFVKEKLQFS